jgi:hypothetical protein
MVRNVGSRLVAVTEFCVLPVAMGATVSDGRFVKIVGGLMQSVHDLAKWGLETGNLTEEELRLRVAGLDPKLRAPAAKKLIASGMSQRAVAKLFDVDESTIREDLRQFRLRENPAPDAGESRTTAKIHGRRLEM